MRVQMWYTDDVSKQQCATERRQSCLVSFIIPACAAGVNNESQQCWEIYAPDANPDWDARGCGSAILHSAGAL